MSAADSLPPALARQLDVLLIDNFDSFTWNLYQQICLLGADVVVIRNDAISPAQFPLLKINSLIISPGPGHPQTDSGISKAAIEYFQGKVPILGVCMGLECLVDLYGGSIAYAGEIMHGKVSRVRHDNRGCFKGIPQGIKSIRYHSLSASLSTLPPELAITSTTEESGVIMGVRHRKYTLEAVQYHPESILSEGGDDLVKNFLSLRGGFWEQNPHAMVNDPNIPPFDASVLPPDVSSTPETKKQIPSILDRIYKQRLEDVAKSQATPGTTYTDLETLLSLNIAPPIIPFLPRLRQKDQKHPSLLAEVKRASPSKGPINTTVSPAHQALTYALAGAHTISVLTEPKWFLGSLQDMLHARLAVANLPNRPAILRKDFILSRYQVLESRVWGADTLLLIVSMLNEPLLRDLYNFSVSLGMEPLVEVNNAKEMELALSLPAKVIGVNNRNLHSFEVDMNTTSRLTDMVEGKGVVLCALSGISSPADVNRYAAEGVGAVLIGESLMRAKDTAKFIRELMSIPEPPVVEGRWGAKETLVKICGIQTKEEAVYAAEAGADMLGIILVPSSKRCIDLERAKEISAAIRSLRAAAPPLPTAETSTTNTPWFTANATRLSTHSPRPLLVGVFQDAPLDEILHAVAYLQLDIVQLHGSETVEFARQIPVPTIKAFHVGKGSGLEGVTRGGAHHFILVDSLRDDGSGVSGGTGKTVDWDLARRVVDAGEIVLDGGASYNAPVPTVIANGDTTANDDAAPAPAKDEAAPETTTTAEPSIPQAPISPYPLPIILAGGITVDTVAEALEKVKPWVIDVSGGVEAGKGPAKDLAKIRTLIAIAKGWDKVPSAPADADAEPKEDDVSEESAVEQ
ncbi:bifunctional tryptophan synthase trp1 [Pleurotus pulmonarius]|nr:bifunctional tryptophan synthase trp1 [Pleurotus pulmonarius]